MAVIPTRTSSATPVSSLGIPNENPNRNADLNAARQGLNDTIINLQRGFEDKQAATQLEEDKINLHRQLRAQYDDDSLNRQGKAGLEDKELGVKSIYQSADEKISSLQGELLKKYDKRHIDMATSHLSSISEGYRDKFAGLEAKAVATHRDNTIKNIYQTSLDDMKTAGAEGGKAGIQKIVDNYKESVRNLSGGQDISQVLRVGELELWRKSIQSLALSNPIKAKEIFNDVAEDFDPDVRELVAKEIEDKRVEFGSDALLERVAGIRDINVKRKIINQEPDEAIKNAASKKVEVAHAREERIISENQARMYSDVWTLAVNKDPSLTIDSIKEMYALTEGQREHLMSMIAPSSSENAQLKKITYAQNEYLLQVAIQKGEKSEQDVWDAVRNGDITPSKLQHYTDMVQEVKNFPSLGLAANRAIEAYSDAFKSPEEKALFLTALYTNVKSLRAKDSLGRLPTDAEVMDIAKNLAAPVVEKHFYNPITWFTSKKEYEKYEDVVFDKESQLTLTGKVGEFMTGYDQSGKEVVYDMEQGIKITGVKDGYYIGEDLNGNKKRLKINE